jgi:hypothetical protein
MGMLATGVDGAGRGDGSRVTGVSVVTIRRDPHP